MESGSYPLRSIVHTVKICYIQMEASDDLSKFSSDHLAANQEDIYNYTITALNYGLNIEEITEDLNHDCEGKEGDGWGDICSFSLRIDRCKSRKNDGDTLVIMASPPNSLVMC